MTEKRAQKIFEKYNPASAVTRCPNGRAAFRASLDMAAKAVVNLYGIIPVADFVAIVEGQYGEPTDAKEVFSLLLPLVRKHKFYCFYKDCLAHHWAIDDFDLADYWLREQAEKPRFIPKKDELLRFEDPYYESREQASRWAKLLGFIDKAWPGSRNTYRLWNELKASCLFGAGVCEASKLLEKYRFEFDSEKQVKTFFDLLADAANHTRLRVNNGYTPDEIVKVMQSRRAKSDSPEIVPQIRKAIGPNNPCPCGSGKKYKKCCRVMEDARTAQLSERECALFFETWYGLMAYVNQRTGASNATILPLYPNPADDEQICKVREALWKNPALIDGYLRTAELPAEKMELLRAWRVHHKRGQFFIVDYMPEYAVVLGSNEQNKDRLYGVKGLSRPLSAAMQRELPIQIEAVLLPFQDKIIYDSFIGTMPISFGEGAKKMLREAYKNTLKHGIVTRLG